MSRMQGRSGPVAELFAILGLDATPLEQGLANAQVTLKDFSTALDGIQRGIFQKLTPAFYAASAAAQALAGSTRTAGEAARFAQNNLADYVRVQESRAEMDRVMNEQALEQTTIMKTLASAQTQWGEATMEAARFASEAMANATESALKLATAQDAAIGGGGRAGGGLGFRMGAGGITPYFRITESIGAAIGPLMDVIFPIAIMDLAINLIRDYGSKISDLIADFEGMGKASRAAWMEAAQGAEQAQIQAAKYLEKLNAVEAAGLKTEARGGTRYKTEAEGIQATIRDLDMRIKGRREEVASLDKEIAALQQQGQPGYPRTYPSTAAGEIRRLQDISDANRENANLADLQKRRAEIVNPIVPTQGVLPELMRERDEEEIKLREANRKALEENTQAIRKWHDVVYELPNRLPYYMSMQSPSFPNMEGRSIVPSSPTFSRSAPSISEFRPSPMGRSTPVAPAQSAGRGVTIQNNYTFAPHFEGVPADIQQFVRDKMEPMIISDLEKNTRGFTADVVRALQAAGIRSTN